MIKKLAHILTYHDSEPTEVLQGLIWFIFAPVVLEAEFFPDLWYVAIISTLIGFGTLHSVVYGSLERRRVFGYLYGIMGSFALFSISSLIALGGGLVFKGLQMSHKDRMGHGA